MLNVKDLAESAVVEQFIQGSGNRTIIFGEYHTQAERNRINSHIRKINESVGVDYILSEEVGEQVLRTKADKESAIEREAYSIGPDSLMLSIELDIPIVGIDDWTDIAEGRSTKDSFAIREKRMCKVIGDYLPKGISVVIIGDTHLRTIHTPELGPPSPICAKFKSNHHVWIVRSPKGEIK